MKRFLRTTQIAAALMALAMLIPSLPAYGWEKVRPGQQKLSSSKIKENAKRNRDPRTGEQRNSKPGMELGGVSATFSLPSARKVEDHLTRSAANPRGTFYAVVPQHPMLTAAEHAYLGRIDSKTGAMTRVLNNAGLRGDDYEWQDAALKGNILYNPSEHASIISSEVYWTPIDITTGEELSRIDFSGNELGAPYSLTYDDSRDRFYGLTESDGSTSYNHIVVVNPIDFSVKELAYVPNKGFLAGICYNPVDQNVYVFNDANHAYILDRETGELNDAGQLVSYDGEYVFNTHEPAALCYSPLDQAFVVAVPAAAAQAYYLYYIDDQSFEVEPGAMIRPVIAGSFISSLVCTDPYAPWEAPALPEVPTINFDKSAVEGTVTVKVPELYFSGVAIPADTKVHAVLTVDGNTLLNEDLAPGQTKDVKVSLTAGEHNAQFTCDLGKDAVGPTASKTFYIGHDNPNPVTNIKLKGKELSWNAPKAGGAHNGYVDASALYYDVYFGNLKQNNRPITDTKYTIYEPADMALTTIKVVAISNGMESEPATLDEIVGKAKTLPMSIMPTREEFDIIKIEDANNDGTTFGYWNPSGLPWEGLANVINYYNDADEWVFLPKTAFPAAKMYNLAVYIGGVYTGTTREDLDIFIGKEATPAAMTQMIWNREQIACPLETNEVSFNFPVAEPGEYYIGFHYRSLKTKKGRGLTLHDFRITETDASTDVPGAIEHVRIVPDAGGKLSADVYVTMPTVDAIGNALDPNKEIAAYIECEGVETSGIATALPGKEGKATVAAATDGFNQFIITPMKSATDYSFGTSKAFTAYVGLDTPLSPKNVKGAAMDNNLTVHLTWDKPGTVGKNGGYVNDDALTYDIYTHSGNITEKVGSSNTLDYDFTPQLAMEGRQYFYWVGPSAVNEVGNSIDLNYHGDIIGKPYELPMIEEYGTTAFDYYPVMRRTGTGYTGGTWSNERDVSGLDVDGSPKVVNGCILYYNETYLPVLGEVMLPKANTIGIEEVVFSTKIWDYSQVPPVTIYGITAGNPYERVKIADIDFKATTEGEWSEQPIVLPKSFSNQPWIQLFICTQFSAREREFLIIDNYKIKQNVDYDMKVNSISCPDQVYQGEVLEVYTEIANSGNESNRGNVHIDLYGDGNYLDRVTSRTPRVDSGKSGNAVGRFEMKAEYAKYKDLEVRVTIEADQDEVATNNVRTAKVKFLSAILPVVTDLKGNYEDDSNINVVLNWSEPNTEYGTSENFEYETPFEITEKIGLFTNVDLDERKCFDIENLTWPNAKEPQAWTVIDTDALKISGDSRIYPHSGKQYIMARALEYEFGQEAAPQACDWLISPEVVPGSEISFWYNTLNPDNTEYVELWVSATDDKLGTMVVPGNGSPDKCGSFYKVRSFSKKGVQTWEQVTYKLPAEAKYFALVYRSFDEIGALLDDIEFTPLNLPKWMIDHYSVWRYVNNDWNTFECVESNVKGNTYTHVGAGDNNAVYYVATHVQTPKGIVDGPRSNRAQINSSGVDDLTNLSGIFGMKGQIKVQGHAGKTLAIYGTDGKYLKSVNVTSESQNIAVEPGIYMVKAGNAMAKVLVK